MDACRGRGVAPLTTTTLQRTPRCFDAVARVQQARAGMRCGTTTLTSLTQRTVTTLSFNLVVSSWDLAAHPSTFASCHEHPDDQTLVGR